MDEPGRCREMDEAGRCREMDEAGRCREIGEAGRGIYRPSPVIHGSKDTRCRFMNTAARALGCVSIGALRHVKAASDPLSKGQSQCSGNRRQTMLCSARVEPNAQFPDKAALGRFVSG